ncbi:MAG: hypothetical protein IJP78_10430 [Clostridia bacterium]|nr:hypothetical protein [Clostridia bacterium]
MKRKNAFYRKAAVFFCAVMAGSLFLFFFLPSARMSALALCNQLFAASERANAYAYDYFQTPENQSAVFAWVLTSVLIGSYFGLALALRSRLLLLLFAVLAALLQAYFGLSLPAWGNAALFLLLGLGVVLFGSPKKSALPFAALALVAMVISAALLPGTDAATESLSETVRDSLAPVTRQEDALTGENPDSALETRHMNSRSLLTGEEKSEARKEYRLLTVEEQQISKPRWIDYLKITLLLLLSAAVVVLPFLPFLYGNARRKKAQEARRMFQSENPGEALCAMFRHAAKYLETGGCGGGNLPYRQWAEAFPERLPESYKEQYAACAALFEEAAYSEHPMTEAQREQTRLFLSETERIFFDEADWKEKLRLRYGKCLHE